MLTINAYKKNAAFIFSIFLVRTIYMEYIITFSSLNTENSKLFSNINQNKTSIILKCQISISIK